MITKCYRQFVFQIRQKTKGSWANNNNALPSKNTSYFFSCLLFLKWHKKMTLKPITHITISNTNFSHIYPQSPPPPPKSIILAYFLPPPPPALFPPAAWPAFLAAFSCSAFASLHMWKKRRKKYQSWAK